ncbi:hypothetical protein AKJ39_02580 [candidate division MSBL1 archaeon SCGC-AAA259J03]|uniref:Uncharacterized protein n=2 Tax=candidate division MSBL1 TaxID=215777 RepID=A0A656YW21_9EURY|nr:hypothetical protein AKJ61_01840 [candidate division MSBL1 archaeon SCGC-AAA259B11]KXA98043.1 hypothetical protein AKJ39_02580 [candidate division MSBL1 archaeon SCGC-AAA259J03]
MNWLKCPECGDDCFKVSQSGFIKCCDCGNQIEKPSSLKRRIDEKSADKPVLDRRDVIPGERFFR